MEAVIAAIWAIVLEIWPWTIIDPWELALRVRRGKKLRNLKPGIRVSLPFLDKVLTEPSTLQTVNIADQTMVSLDQVNVSASGVIKYYVLDLKQMWMAVHDSDEAISNTALEAVATEIALKRWDHLYVLELAKAAQKRLRSDTRGWGIRIKSFKLTDLADSKVHRIMSSNGDNTLVLGGE